MERKNRPQGREKHITEGNGSVEIHGQGLGGGPRGDSKGYSDRKKKEGQSGKGSPEDLAKAGLGAALLGGALNQLGQSANGSSGSQTPFESQPSSGGQQSSGNNPYLNLQGGNGGGTRRNGSCLTRILPILLLIVVVLFVIKLVGGLSGGQNSSQNQNSSPQGFSQVTSAPAQNNAPTPGPAAVTTTPVPTPAATETPSPTPVPTEAPAVSSEAREKFTQLAGGGRDTATIMVYMCGTDLESKYGMATNDLSEMVNASLDDSKVNLIVYTGGCSRWQNRVLSTRTNQIYRIHSGGLEPLEEDLGSLPMTDPNTLVSFIRYCSEKFPANRNSLIFWDHGGGTLSGYGVDEKFPNSGSMMLNSIAGALRNSGVKFDFVGFDACLMATLETAMAIEPYADYMIASEETEPGYGWYYTDWLNKLSSNTSTDTVSLGKIIADTFVRDNQSKGQKETTLSVIDLAEASETIPFPLDSFSTELLQLVTDGSYSTVAKARAETLEFGASAGLDQIDLIDFCEHLGTESSRLLSKALRGIVKYNVNCRGYSNANGVSVYFPYRKLSYLSTVMSTLNTIGFNSNYISACQKFATMGAGGQISGGGSYNPLDQLLGGYGFGSYGSSYSSGSSSQGYSNSYYGNSYSYGGSNGSYDLIGQLFSSFLGGRSIAPDRNVNGLTSENSEWIDTELLKNNIQYFADHSIDTNLLYWTGKNNGTEVLTLPEEQWDIIQSAKLNLLYDNGSGYIDLGMDSTVTFDKDGDLVREWDGTWIAVNGNIVPYYEMSNVSEGRKYTITGRVPCRLNDTADAYMILQFTDENPTGEVLGFAPVGYNDNEDALLGKIVPIDDYEHLAGVKVSYVSDFYDYDGNYSDSYAFGTPFTIENGMPFTISNVAISNPEYCDAMVCLTDIYSQRYWTPSINH